MKKQFLLLTLLLCYCVSNAENIEFADENFKQALIDEGVDTDGDGEISEEEAEVVTSLSISAKDITNLEGIEYFINLTLLNAISNKMTSVDLSKNTKLTELRLYYVITLTEIDISGANELVTLDLSYCSLTSIDISTNHNLEYLSLFNNKMTELDVSNNTNLTELILGVSNAESDTTLEFVCAADENITLVNDEIAARGFTDVTVSTDCDEEEEEEEVVYEFLDILDIGSNITSTGVFTLSVTDLGLEEGVELTSTYVLNVMTFESESFLHGGSTEATLDLSNLSSGTYIIVVTTNIGVYDSNFVKL